MEVHQLAILSFLGFMDLIYQLKLKINHLSHPLSFTNLRRNWSYLTNLCSLNYLA